MQKLNWNRVSVSPYGPVLGSGGSEVEKNPASIAASKKIINTYRCADGDNMHYMENGKPFFLQIKKKK
jgi:hypothetical protein